MKAPDDIVQVLYGCEAYFRNCPAFCRHHHCHLTEKQIKTKGCLGKQCKFLDKIEHDFWRQREEKKLQKMKMIIILFTIITPPDHR